MIWPFAARGARADTVLPDVDELPPLEAFIDNDSVLKVWLPSRLSARVDWLSVHHGTSRPDVLRAILFEHVYGRVAMRRLEVFAREREKELGIERPFFSNRPEDRNGAEPAAATPRQVNLQMLGKAANDFKLHLPQRLKDDLASLAAAHRITASHYVRKALVLTLMGERFHTAWQSALGALAAGEPVPPDVTRFEAE